MYDSASPEVSQKTRGIIVVDHGSRRKQSNQRLLALVEMFRRRLPDTIIEPAHMELASPSIADAYAKCVERGANLILVNPFFLLPGRHWKQDIPELTNEAAKAFPETEYLVTAPLELHPLMLQIMSDRIETCLASASGSDSGCEVCRNDEACIIRKASD